jgi:hypothetical protein
MLEIRALRKQLCNIVKAMDPSIDIQFETRMPPPTEEQVINEIIK